MTIWFTSDLHLGHEKIIEYAKRPFANVQEMDEKLIRKWNALVGDRDTVYHLGDFCFGNPDPYLNRLKGKKMMIMGDHDRQLMEAPYYIQYRSDVTIIAPIYTITTPYEEYGHRVKLTLAHYSMRSWPLSHYGSWHLFGHHHGSLEIYGKSFDIGVDAWSYEPIPLERVKVIMDSLIPIEDYRSKDVE